MKEIKDIIKAHDVAKTTGRQMALATVVKVEGSSYRRPGARMLVTDDGNLTGAISGGCLEGDALRKALLAINQGANKLVTYDTTDEDDAKLGVQLGCNGIVYILFEPVTNKHNPIELLRQAVLYREPGILLTEFTLENTLQPGTLMYLRSSLTEFVNTYEENVRNQVEDVFRKGVSTSSPSAQKSTEVFIDYVRPAVSLVVAGAGNDVQPLVNMAFVLGWETTVVDGRPTHATNARFPKADRVLVAKPNDVLPQLQVDNETVFLLMTHNYNYDLSLLSALLNKEVSYIGVLGPKSKLERMLDELQANGQAITPQQRNTIYGPVGLDIGAETSEEIALSILSEIKAFLSNRNGGMLKHKNGFIHGRQTITSNHE